MVPVPHFQLASIAVAGSIHHDAAGEGPRLSRVLFWPAPQSCFQETFTIINSHPLPWDSAVISVMRERHILDSVFLQIGPST